MTAAQAQLEDARVAAGVGARKQLDQPDHPRADRRRRRRPSGQRRRRRQLRAPSCSRSSIRAACGSRRRCRPRRCRRSRSALPVQFAGARLSGPAVRRAASSGSARRPIRSRGRCRSSCRFPNTGGRLVAGLFAEGRVAQQTRRGAGRAADRGQHVGAEGAVGAARHGRQGRERSTVDARPARRADRARRDHRAASRRATAAASARRRAITPGTPRAAADGAAAHAQS